MSLDNLNDNPDKVVPNSCMTSNCHTDLSYDEPADLEAMMAGYDTKYGEGEGIVTPKQVGYVGKNTCITCHSSVMPTTIPVTIEEKPVTAPELILTAERENDPETA